MTALRPADAGLPAVDVWRLRRRTTAVQQGSAVEPSARVLWGLAALLLTAYAIAFAWLSPLLLQDFPNHLARTWVMSDLVFHHGAQFGQAFRYQFAAIPYILGDLTLVGATEIFGISAAAALWSLVVFLSLPCALLFYLRTLSIPPASRALLLILSAFLATDWFFLVGFLEFRLGVAMALVVLGMAEWVRQRPTMARLATYAGILILGYLTHLTTLVFATAALGTTALLRLVSHRSAWRTEFALLAPCGAIFLYHFSSGYAYRAPGDLVEVPFIWDTLKGKLLRLGGEFDRFGRADGALLGALALSLGLHIGRVRLKDLKDPVVLEMLVLAGMFLAMYFALPVGYPEAYYVDVRALPFAFLFVIFAVVRSTAARAQSEGGLGEKGRSWEGQRKTLAVLIACALVVANLAYLVKHFRVHRGWLNEYRAVMASIPLHARVLPVYTHGPDGKVVPFLHAFSFAVIDRNAIVPYLQTGDTGNPEKYLRYRNRPYSPAQGWYGDVDAPPVDWRAAVCDYDFLLATKPFDRSRLRVPLTSIAENESAALFALPGRRACR